MVGLGQLVRFPREFVRHPSYQLGTALYLWLSQVRQLSTHGLRAQVQRAVRGRSAGMPVGKPLSGIRCSVLIWQRLHEQVMPHYKQCTAVLLILSYDGMLRGPVRASTHVWP